MIEDYGHKKQEIKRIWANILGACGKSFGRDENGGKWHI